MPQAGLNDPLPARTVEKGRFRARVDEFVPTAIVRIVELSDDEVGGGHDLDYVSLKASRRQ